MIVAKKIEKSINKTQILLPTDLVLRPGTITTVVGPNGSGKSTLLRCLCMIDPPDRGQISIDKREYAFPSYVPLPPSPWPGLTAVFQGLHLWPHLKIRDNILLPARLRKDPEMDRMFTELIEELDLGDALDRFPSEISGGERQRSAVARALILRPRYLFLDEPTSASDVEHADALGNRLCEMARRESATIFLVTHMLGLARKVSDFLMFMEAGAVLARGGPDLLSSTENERVARFVSIA
jgi:ABC-type polar amino acid transport system ATPase subunit